MLFLDGAYTFSGRGPSFHRARRPTDTELAQLLDTLSRRSVRLLERRFFRCAKTAPFSLLALRMLCWNHSTLCTG
jgi:hypothetical protein